LQELPTIQRDVFVTIGKRGSRALAVKCGAIMVPGGIGTVLETMMIWQLLQVQKLHDTPLILAGKMYAELRRSGAASASGTLE